jgi:hypothetical protein
MDFTARRQFRLGERLHLLEFQEIRQPQAERARAVRTAESKLSVLLESPDPPRVSFPAPLASVRYRGSDPSGVLESAQIPPGSFRLSRTMIESH